MRYGFINNFEQLLAADLAAGATTLALDGGGADLSNASADLVYTLTLDDGEGAVEIIHVTGTSGNDLTIEKGQEGTTDAAWPTGSAVEMRLTAGAASGFLRNETDQSDSFATGGASTTILNSCMAIGESASAPSFATVSLGPYAVSTGQQSVVIGSDAYGDGEDIVAVGSSVYADGSEITAVGRWVYASGLGATGYGYNAAANAAGALSVGADSSAAEGGAAIGVGAESSAEGAVALGSEAVSGVIGGVAVAGLHYLTSQQQGRAGLPSACRAASAQAVLATAALDLTDDTAFVTLDLPAGARLFIDSIDVIITGSDSPGGSPEISVGPDDVAPAAYLASTPVAKTVVGERETHAPLAADGVTSLRVATTTAGTGTAYQAKVTFRGYVMEL